MKFNSLEICHFHPGKKYLLGNRSKRGVIHAASSSLCPSKDMKNQTKMALPSVALPHWLKPSVASVLWQRKIPAQLVHVVTAVPGENVQKM